MEHSPLSWIARNSSKPGRPPLPDVWVAHASPAWSADHLELEPAAAAWLLLDAFREATGSGPHHMQWHAAHRWRYARAAEGDAPCSLLDRSLRIGLCGDWLSTSRIEGAFLSGWDLAGRLLREFGIAAEPEARDLIHSHRTEPPA